MRKNENLHAQNFPAKEFPHVTQPSSALVVFFSVLSQRNWKKTIQVNVSDPLLALSLVSLTRWPVSASYGVNTSLLGKRSETAIFN